MSFTGGDVTASMSSRRKARKRALDVLYEADLRREPITDLLADYLGRLESPKPVQLDFTVALVEGVAAERDRVDELIASYAEGWTLDRMPVVDRNLARIAVYELLYRDDVDDAVAITEAVELAKSLSTEDSPRFLNGLLGRIAEYATR
jgi:N utilization substance protein B